MLVHIHYFHNDIKYEIPEFTVTMNQAIRDDQPIIMYIPDPENKMIKSESYCLEYSWKPISVEFEVPSEMMDVDFEHRAWFGLLGDMKDKGGIVYGDYIPYYTGHRETVG